MRPSISLVIPAFNEEESIGAVIDEFRGCADEILVIDNQRTDETVKVARGKGAIVHEVSCEGFGDTVLEGLSRAAGDYLALVEADSTFVASDLSRLTQRLNEYDVVCGTRTLRDVHGKTGHLPLHSRVANWAVGKFLQFAFFSFSRQFTDVGCTYRVLKRTAFIKIKNQLRTTGPEFLVEMVIGAIKCDLAVLEIPVTYRRRARGESKYSSSLAKLVRNGLRMVWLILSERLRQGPRKEMCGQYSPPMQSELDAFLRDEHGRVLVRGAGKSYGDSCSNSLGPLLSLKHFSSIEIIHTAKGDAHVRAGAGASMDEILKKVISKGWTLSVVPGERAVTVGGAIAHDVHGKNHFLRGAFGNQVLRLEIQRTSGERMLCSREENSEWFRATVGGLGLTGIILWAEIKLARLKQNSVCLKHTKFSSLDELEHLFDKTKHHSEFLLAWLDAMNRPEFQGILIQASQATESAKRERWSATLPAYPLSESLVRILNKIFLFTRSRRTPAVRELSSILFPMGDLKNWYASYGKKGCLHTQLLLPSFDSTRELLTLVSKQKERPYLCMMKVFGPIPAEGLLSFTGEGISVLLEYPNHGETTRRVLDVLDTFIVGKGGRIYPAKDKRVSSEHFQKMYPRIKEFRKYRDEGLSSDYARRVGI